MNGKSLPVALSIRQKMRAKREGAQKQSAAPPRPILRNEEEIDSKTAGPTPDPGKSMIQAIMHKRRKARGITPPVTDALIPQETDSIENEPMDLNPLDEEPSLDPVSKRKERLKGIFSKSRIL